MELNGLEADEFSGITQMTVTKKEQNTEKPTKKQAEKSRTQTPKRVPNKTLKNDRCRYCKEADHMMTDCPKLEEDPEAEKRQSCNTPGQKEENCYFGANTTTEWNLTEAQKTLLKPIIKLENQYKLTKNKHNNPRQRI